MTLIAVIAALVLGLAVGVTITYWFFNTAIQDRIMGSLSYVEDEDGVYPIIYTNKDVSEIMSYKSVIFRIAQESQTL